MSPKTNITMYVHSEKKKFVYSLLQGSAVPASKQKKNRLKASFVAQIKNIIILTGITSIGSGVEGEKKSRKGKTESGKAKKKKESEG